MRYFLLTMSLLLMATPAFGGGRDGIAYYVDFDSDLDGVKDQGKGLPPGQSHLRTKPKPEEGSAIIRVSLGGFAARAQALGVSCILAQQGEGELSQCREVLRRVILAHPAVVFPEGHIQHPMQPVLDAPVCTRCQGKVFGLGNAFRANIREPLKTLIFA